MPNSYSRRSRSNNSTFALLSKPPLAPAPQVEGRLVTPGGVGQLSPAQGGHHSIAKPPALRPGRGPAGGPEGPDPSGSEAGARRLRRLARPRPARACRAPLRGPLQRERGQAAAARARPELAEGAAGPPRGRPEGAGAVQKNLPGLI